MKIVLDIADSLFEDVLESYQHRFSLYGADIETMKNYLSSKILAQMKICGKDATITLNNSKDFKIINPIIEIYMRDRFESLAKLQDKIYTANMSQDTDLIERAEKAYRDLFDELPIY